MKKRIIIALTLFSLFAGLVPVGAAERSENYSAFDVISGFGLMEQAEEEENITRARFAALVHDIACYGQTELSEKSIFGDRYKDAEFLGEIEEETLFEDLPISHEYYDKVSFVNAFGLMKGVGGNLFAPDDTMKLEHALKVLVGLLGYEQKALHRGGGISGYVAVASELKLLRGVSADAALDGKTLARVIYNALDVPMAQQKTVRADESEFITVKDETLMTEVLGLSKVSGMITENGRTGFWGESTIAGDAVKIGGTVYRLPVGSEFAGDYIGRYVDCYYVKEGEPDELDVVWAGISAKDDAEVFDLKDFVSFESGLLQFDEDGKTVSKRIAGGAAVIYNGLATQTLTKEMFDYDSGEVALISIDSANADLVIIDGFRGGVVEYVDSSDGVIYDSVGKGDLTKFNIKTPVKEIGKKVRIYDADNKPIALSKITSGMLLDISENGDVKKIIAYNGTEEEITISSVADDGKKITVTTEDGAEYDIAKSLKGYLYFDATAGKKYSAKINRHGEIAWLSQPGADNWSVGILTDGERNSKKLDGEIRIKLFMLNDKFEVHECADSVMVHHTDGTEQKIKDRDKLLSAALANKGLCRFKTNSEGKITVLEFPLPLGDTSTQRDRLRVLYDTKVGGVCELGTDKSFNGQAFYRQGYSRIFYAPKDYTQEEDFEVLSRQPNSFENKKSFVAYAINPDTLLTDYYIFQGPNTVSGGIKNTGPLVVTSISSVLDADGAEMKKVTGMRWNVGEQTIYFRAEDQIYENLRDPAGKAEPAVLTKGDVIMTDVDSANIVIRANIVYKADAVNPRSANGQKGWLYGSTGICERDDAGIPVADGTVQNPYAISDNSGQLVQGSGSTYMSVDNRRFIYAWVYDYADGIMTVTTQNLAEEEYDPNSSIYLTEGHLLKAQTMYVHYQNGKVEAKKNATESDIKSYKDFGTDCTRLFAATYWGETHWGIIMDGYYQ